MKTVVLCVAMGLAGAGVAQAATVTVSSANSNVFGVGDQRWYQAVSYTNGTQTKTNIAAGAFRLIATNGNGPASPFLAFCLSPFETLVLPKVYEVAPTLSAQVVTRLRALANGAWSQIVGKTSAAAFQLAAWEIVSETGNTLDVRAGIFRVTSAQETTLNKANDWLASVTDGSFAAAPHHTTILSADGTQDLLTNDLSPVPLPGALGFLTFGLAAFAAIGRARRV